MALKPAIHGRDHCPGGADPIPCLPLPKVFRAVQWNEETNTSSLGTMDQLFFDYYSNPDDTVFEVETDVNGNLVSVYVATPGFVVCTLDLYWPVSFDSSVAGIINDSEQVFPPSGQEFTRKLRDGYNEGMTYSVTLTRHYPTILWDGGEIGGGSEQPSFSFFAGQNSGSARDVQGRVDLAVWSAYTGPVTQA